MLGEDAPDPDADDAGYATGPPETRAIPRGLPAPDKELREGHGCQVLDNITWLFAEHTFYFSIQHLGPELSNLGLYPYHGLNSGL